MPTATEEIADTPTSRTRNYRTTAICDTARFQAKTRSRFPMNLSHCQIPWQWSGQIKLYSVDQRQRHIAQARAWVVGIKFELEVNMICSVLNSLIGC